MIIKLDESAERALLEVLVAHAQHHGDIYRPDALASAAVRMWCAAAAGRIRIHDPEGVLDIEAGAPEDAVLQ